VGRLEKLPERLESLEGRLTVVELQIVQLRGELSDGFSALRSDSRKLAEMMDERFIRQGAEMRRLNDLTNTEIRRLNSETNTQMRMLYEDLKSTIKLIGEGPPS
jgi:hypothetical protein